MPVGTQLILVELWVELEIHLDLFHHRSDCLSLAGMTFRVVVAVVMVLLVVVVIVLHFWHFSVLRPFATVLQAGSFIFTCRLGVIFSCPSYLCILHDSMVSLTAFVRLSLTSIVV